MKTVGDLLYEFKEFPEPNQNLPVLTLTEHNGFVYQTDRFKKRLATADTSKYKVVGLNDIAFNPYLLWAGAVAQNTITQQGVISPLYPTFRVRRGYEPKYVARLLLTPRMVAAYDNIAFGSIPRRRRSSVDDFLNLSIPPVPDFNEQQRITKILDRADVLRSKRRKVLEYLDALEQSIFLSMFGKDIADKKVEEILDSSKGSIRTGPFGSQLLHREFVDSGIAVLGLDNVTANEFRWGERRYITKEKYAQLQRYTVHPGDVLISIMGTTGRCAIVPADIPTAINTKHICAITLNPNLALPDFVRAAFLWHKESRMHLYRQTKGSVMDGLNMGIIKNMPLPLPAMERQIKYVNAISEVRETRRPLRMAMLHGDELFASLQSRAFRGEL